MRKNLKHLLILMGVSFLISGCNDNNGSAEKEKTKAEEVSAKEDSKDDTEDTNKEEIPEENLKVEPLPDTYQELAELPPGEHREIVINHNEEDYKKAMEKLKDLPELPASPTTDELDFFYNEVLKKVQADYEGPEKAIAELQFQSIGDPEATDSRYKFKENLNVEIILDASGSMKEADNGRVRMDAAKASILQFVQKLPKEAKVGLRVYGHKGSGSETDKQISCASSEMLYNLSSYDSAKFQQMLNSITPAGWTPTGLALTEAKKDLEKFNGENNTNIIYLVSDGISTCDDNPVDAAGSLFNSNISPIINVIGFNVDSKGQAELKKIAQITKGLYSDVADENELSKELTKLGDVTAMWDEWKRLGDQALKSKHIQNSLDIFSYIVDEEHDSNFERLRVSSILHLFWKKEKISRESYDYLEQRNRDYHEWIDGEIMKFKVELKALNEKGYSEALKTLEEKYQENSN